MEESGLLVQRKCNLRGRTYTFQSVGSLQHRDQRHGSRQYGLSPMLQVCPSFYTYVFASHPILPSSSTQSTWVYRLLGKACPVEETRCSVDCVRVNDRLEWLCHPQHLTKTGVEVAIRYEHWT